MASDTLVALSRNHFNLVMYELQHHLKPLNLTDEFVIVTLAKLAHGNGRARGSPASASGPLSLVVAAPLRVLLVSAPCPSRALSSRLPLAFLLGLSLCLPWPLALSLCVSASRFGLQPSVMPSPLNLSLLPSSRVSCFSSPFLSLSPFSLVPSPRVPQTGTAGTGVAVGPPRMGSALTKDHKQESRRPQYGTVGVKGTTGGCLRPGTSSPEGPSWGGDTSAVT